MEGDDDDDPDGQDGAMTPGPIHSLIQPVLATKKLTASADDVFLAPTTHTAPPRWRKTEAVKTVILQVDGVEGQDSTTAPGHCLIQRFLVTKKFPVGLSDDFLAPSPNTAPRLWRKSENGVAGFERVNGIEVVGCGLEVVRARGGDMKGEGTDRGRRGQSQAGAGVDAPDGRGEVLDGAAIHAPECTGAVG